MLNNTPKLPLPKSQYTPKEYEAFNLYSIDRNKLIKLIAEGYFDGSDSILISKIIDKVTKDCFDELIKRKEKKQDYFNQMVLAEQNRASIEIYNKQKLEEEKEQENLNNLRILLNLK